TPFIGLRGANPESTALNESCPPTLCERPSGRAGVPLGQSAPFQPKRVSRITSESHSPDLRAKPRHPQTRRRDAPESRSGLGGCALHGEGLLPGRLPRADARDRGGGG